MSVTLARKQMTIEYFTTLIAFLLLHLFLLFFIITTHTHGSKSSILFMHRWLWIHLFFTKEECKCTGDLRTRTVRHTTTTATTTKKYLSQWREKRNTFSLLTEKRDTLCPSKLTCTRKLGTIVLRLIHYWVLDMCYCLTSLCVLVTRMLFHWFLSFCSLCLFFHCPCTFTSPGESFLLFCQQWIKLIMLHSQTHPNVGK